MDKNTFVFSDENGEKHEFEIIHTFEVDNIEYSVVQPNDLDEALLLKVEYDKEGNSFLSEIQDQKEFEEVKDYYFELINEE